MILDREVTMYIEIFRSLVRPVATLAIVAGIIAGFFMGLVAPEAFMGVAILIVKYWFDAPDEVKKQ